jgi:uncharacterized protein (UPF0332 family)
LIATAEKLTRGSGKPRQSDIKRAVSTIYYAMFHALCRNTADMLVGKTKAARSQPAWLQTYRAVDHGFAKGQCKHGVIKKFPKEIEDFAVCFVDMQEARHRADYDPASKFTRGEVTAMIREASAVIGKIGRVASSDRVAFAAFVVMRQR